MLKSREKSFFKFLAYLVRFVLRWGDKEVLWEFDLSGDEIADLSQKGIIG